LKCNKADPDGMPLPKGGVRVICDWILNLGVFWRLF
jgi:hypothetical protein